MPRTTQRRQTPAHRPPKDWDPQVSEEALRILYRLRAGLLAQGERSAGVLEAVEWLIEKYEKERA
jgi:hypothetical protein